MKHAQAIKKYVGAKSTISKSIQRIATINKYDTKIHLNILKIEL